MQTDAPMGKVALPGLVACVGLTLFVSEVAAATEAPPAADVFLAGSLGASRFDFGGVSHRPFVGLDALIRWHALEAGVGAEWKTMVSWNALDAHVSLGLALPLAPIRLEILGVGGVRDYPDWGRAFLGSDPGATAALPYAGARLRVSHELARKSGVAALLGISAGYDRDLWRKHVDYTYIDEHWLNLFGTSEPTVTQGHQDIGASYWSLALNFGVTVGLL